MAYKTKGKSDGIIEDVLIIFDKFIISADFIFLSYDVDDRMPIILGHPFLVTGEALINFREGTLK